MTKLLFTAIAGILALCLALCAVTPVRAQSDVAAANSGEDFEVQARGPVHEAFAEPIQQRPLPSAVVPKQPPDPIEELPPEQKPEGDDVIWIPGYFAWDEERNGFLWVSGIYRVPPPGREWTPGSWREVPGGWQWSPGFWSLVNEEEVNYLPPPPEPVAAAPGTAAPNPYSTYVPGIWVYRTNRYVWRSGYWLDPRPGWIWIPDHYVCTPYGYVFVPGYWDLELRRRGLCFAPVYFHRPVWRTAGWYYRPSYCVSPDFLTGCLFVRTGWNSYYFGDYFEVGYRQRGFTAWIDFRLGRHSHDPLFSYYRWAHRDDHRWLTDVRSLYTARYAGEALRPPRTLVQQNTIIKNITVNNVTNTNVTVNNIKNVTALTAINKMDPAVVKLQNVTPQQRQRDLQTTKALRNAAEQRARLEAKLTPQATGAAVSNRKPQNIKLDVPKSGTKPAATASKLQPPPLPTESVRSTKPGGTPAAKAGQGTPGTGTPKLNTGRPGTPSSGKIEPRPKGDTKGKQGRDSKGKREDLKKKVGEDRSKGEFPTRGPGQDISGKSKLEGRSANPPQKGAGTASPQPRRGTKSNPNQSASPPPTDNKGTGKAGQSEDEKKGGAKKSKRDRKSDRDR